MPEKMGVFNFPKIVLTLLLIQFVGADENFQKFLTSAVNSYSDYFFTQPFDANNTRLRGGAVTTQYIVDINHVQLRGVSSYQEIEVSANLTNPIVVKLNFPSTTISMDGIYELDGLLDSNPTNGFGNFVIIPNIKELSVYYRQEVDAEGFVTLKDASGFYSTYLPKSFQFEGMSTLDVNYQKTIATAISEYTCKNMWLVYHNEKLLDYLNCVLQSITLEEILNGKTSAENDCSGMSLPTSTTETSWTSLDPTDMTSTDSTFESTEESSTTASISSTTSIPKTTTISSTTTIETTSSEPPDLEFYCLIKPDNYYPHPYSCRQFIHCLRGITSIYFCPHLTFYDPVKQFCVAPQFATCNVE